MSNKVLKLAVIGCGNRGTIYAKLASEMPEKYKLTAASDPNPLRVNKIKEFSGNPDFKTFSTAEELLACDKLADVIIIATQDKFHYAPCKSALEKGYDVLLEKPIATSMEEIIDIQNIAEKLGRKLQVCYVLRYTPFYRKVKDILDSGVIGDVISVNANEGVHPWHQAHSYVRGKWCKVSDSSPMIVAKCSHDTDIIQWLINQKCVSVSSYGDLTYFKKDNMPEGAPARCTDGCPHSDTCYYNALRYAGDMREPWLEVVYDNFENATEEEIIEWLKTSDYGRCVFQCDNDAVDHQVVSMEFENKVTANLTMTAFDIGRSIEIFGTKGSLKGGFFIKKISGYDVIVTPWDGEEIKYVVSDDTTEDHHMGGDEGIMNALYEEMTGEGEPVASYIQSHTISYAAEESRIKGNTVSLKEFVQSVN